MGVEKGGGGREKEGRERRGRENGREMVNDTTIIVQSVHIEVAGMSSTHRQVGRERERERETEKFIENATTLGKPYKAESGYIFNVHMYGRTKTKHNTTHHITRGTFTVTRVLNLP